MAVPVLQTKITPPRRRDEILSRKRLMDLFDDLLDRKLVIINAPAGYGKTSLLCDLAHKNELPYCWYSLDSFDKDIQRFLAYFVASLRLRFPEFGKQSLAALQVLDSESLSLEQMQVTIVNEIYQTIREHFVIVLDNYHTVDDSQEINSFVNWFIQVVDQNCHVVILSRSLLPLSDLPLMVARSQVDGIGLEELAFKADEIQALMLQNYHQTIPETVANEMMQTTEGWITGLLLSAQAMWKGMADQLRTTRVSGVDLYDYLIHQVLDQQPVEMREILLKTSFLEEFNAELCAAVLGEPPPGETWQEILVRIQNSNLFVVPIGEGETWLRYHPLFQDFLQNQMAKERPGETRQIRKALIKAYSERSDWERAYVVCQQLADSGAVADLLEHAAGPLVVDGRFGLLHKWLEELPKRVLRQRPILLARQGLVLATQGDTMPGLRLLDEAVDHFRGAGDAVSLAWTLTWRALVQFIRANYALSLTDAGEALVLMQGKEGDPDYAQVSPEAHRICGQDYRMLGRLDEAVASFSRSLAFYEAQANEKRINLLLLDLGAVHLDAGDFVAALSCYQQALEHYKRQNNFFLLCSVLNDMAFLYYLQGDYLKAFSTFEDALSKARQSANLRVEAMVLIGVGDLYVDLEAFQDALDSYRLARPIIEQINDRFLMIYLHLAEVGVARLKSDFLSANVYLNAAGQIAEQSPNGYFRGLYSLELGRLALAEKDNPRACTALAEAVHLFDAGGQQLERGRALFLLAAASFNVGDTQAAEMHLESAFNLASGLESRHFIVPSARLVRSFLRAMTASPLVGGQALRLSERVDQFERSITSFRRRLRRQGTVVTPRPPRLQIQALGQAQVRLGDRPVASADWQTQVTRDLFYLILSRESGWTKEAIGEILWPESSPAQLRLRFKNTIYRLRRALQQDVILFDGDHYTFNRDLDYGYDVEQFMEYLSLVAEKDDLQGKIRAYRSAVDLYQGDYLPEIDGAWLLSQQERLRQAFVKAGLQLAALYLENQQFDQSWEISNRVIAVDPFLEDAYVAAMRAHAAAGNRPAIIRVYENLVKTLRDELDTHPSLQTTALYRSLVG